MQSGVRDMKLPITAAGTLIANMEMKFLEVEKAGESARGPGEITVRGPNVMMCVYPLPLNGTPRF